MFACLVLNDVQEIPAVYRAATADPRLIGAIIVFIFTETHLDLGQR